MTAQSPAAAAPLANRPSLRRQLAVGLVLVILSLWLLAVGGTVWVVRHELDEVFDSALQETAERILPLTVIELLDTENDGMSRRINRITEHSEYLTYIVRGADGRILLHSHDADETLFATPRPEGFQTEFGHRFFTRFAVSGAYAIEMAEPLAHRDDAALGAMTALAAPVLLLVPLSLLGIFWVVGRALRPVENLRREVTARDGADLRPVEIADLPAEVATIALAINQLLDRLKRTLEAERSFTANSAHELRTPIAASLAQTQRLIAEAPPGPLADRARQIEAQLKRLARLSEKLMQLARAEGGVGWAETAQDLVPVLNFVVEDFRRAGAGDRLQLVLPEGARAPLRMDPDAFGILARNLIENALRHGEPLQPVTVKMARNGTFSVANGGAVIAPDKRARLTTRFVRGDARGDGSGLGLAIADTIAHAAGARLTLHSPATGRDDGFEAVLHPPHPLNTKETP